MGTTKKEFYENGNVKGEYQVNESGERHGTTKLYHENGQLKMEMNWTNGIQDDGEIISYHDNGVKERQVIRSKGSFNGAFTEWHKNGQKKLYGTYKNNKPNILKEWNIDGYEFIGLDELVKFSFELEDEELKLAGEYFDQKSQQRENYQTDELLNEDSED